MMDLAGVLVAELHLDPVVRVLLLELPLMQHQVAMMEPGHQEH